MTHACNSVLEKIVNKPGLWICSYPQVLFILQDFIQNMKTNKQQNKPQTRELENVLWYTIVISFS